MSVAGRTPQARFTDVDLSTLGTTQIYNPDRAATVWEVGMKGDNGSGARSELQITDGTDAAVIADSEGGQGGNDIAIVGPVELNPDVELQIEVVTAGSGSVTAVVIASEE